MNVEILIVTHARDLDYLRYCLKSIAIFTRGFSGVTIVVPVREVDKFQAIVPPMGETQVIYAEEEKGKGFLSHLVEKCFADSFCPRADAVLHLDADTVFWQPSTPADFFAEGKPILYREKYADLVNPNRRYWQKGVNAALGFKPEFETMVRHPAVHWRGTYGAMRRAVEAHTGMGFRDYVMTGPNDWPQWFCEFNTLGAIAIRDFADRYSFVDYNRAADAKRFSLKASDGTWQYCYDRNRDHVAEFWSGAGVDVHRPMLNRIINRDAPDFLAR